MRVSSTMMVDNYLNQTNRVYESQTKLMEQSDGSKLHRPSDDAIGYAKYLRYSFNQVENNRYKENVSTGISWMKSTNAAIMDMEDCIKTVIDKTVQGGNDTNGGVDLKAIAAEMEAMVQQTVSDANMQVGNRYVLAGQNDKTQPFVTSENTIERGVAKTLDEQQQKFFAGCAVTNSNGTAQMLTLKGSDGGTYYLDTTGGYIFTEDFVQNGYKDLIAQGHSTVDPITDSFGRLGTGAFNSISGHFTSTGEIYAQLGQTNGTKPVKPVGGGTNQMPSVNYSVQDYIITLSNGTTFDTSSSPATNAATGYTINNDGSISFTNNFKVMADGEVLYNGTQITPAPVPAATISSVNEKNYDFVLSYTSGDVNSDGTNSLGIVFPSTLKKATGYDRKADGTISFYVMGSSGQKDYSNCMEVRSNGDIYVGGRKYYSGSGSGSSIATPASVNSYGVMVNGVDLTFATVEQKIVTYNGDYNYISMVKENGSIKPDSDTVNVTAADVFGTDIFDNEASGNDISGTAGLNQLYTIVAKADTGDSHWLSSDGITVANAVYDKALVAQTKVAARLSVYNDVSSMLEEHGLTITDDISAVADTDVAQLSVLLNTITTIYSMSLAVGSRVLPMSLADYL